MLIDSHVNLHAPQFDDDREAVISRALAAGVRLMVNISDRVSNYEAVRQVARHPDIWCTVGTHPHEAKEDPDLAAGTLVALAADPRVVGIGETGLDFHYDLSPRHIQAKVFRAHAAAARETGLPLIVHTREADAEMGDILEDELAKGPFRLLMHCYTSGPELAARGGCPGRMVLGFPALRPSRRPRTCAPLFAACRKIGSSSRPTAPTLRPCLIAVGATSPPSCRMFSPN